MKDRRDKGRFSVLRGTFQFVSGLISKHDIPDFEVMTAYGSIGIRGTTFWGGMLRQDYGDSYTDSRSARPKENFGVYVDEGEVFFETNLGSKTITKGEGSFTSNINKPPSEPKLWSEEMVNAAVAKIALKDDASARAKIEEIKAAR